MRLMPLASDSELCVRMHILLMLFVMQLTSASCQTSNPCERTGFTEKESKERYTTIRPTQNVINETGLIINTPDTLLPDRCQVVTPEGRNLQCTAHALYESDSSVIASVLRNCIFKFEALIYDNNPSHIMLTDTKVKACEYRTFDGNALPTRNSVEGICFIAKLDLVRCQDRSPSE